MKVGVIADTHDNLKALDYLVSDLEVEGVEVVLHAGDFISPFTIPRLAEFSGGVYGVFGNNDGDRQTLKEKAQNTDVNLTESPFELELAGREIVVSHRPESLPDSEATDVLIHGHSHSPRVEKTGRSLILNPGEAGGWLSGTTHFALLELEDLTAKIRTVPAP